MNLGRVAKKFREAAFFLELMRLREEHVVGNPDEFDFYLSAFLNAARVVDYRLRHEQGDTYKAWRKAWDATLGADDLRLIRFIDDDRAAEVHESGSNRDERFTPYGVQMDDSKVVAFVKIDAPRPGALAKSDYYFTIDGAEQRAVDACARYVELLRGMLVTLQADHP